MKKFKHLFKEMDNPDSPSRAAMSLKEKPNKEPMAKMKEQLDVKTPSVEVIAKKHGVDVSVIEKQLKVGMKVEMEHTTNEKTAREITLDHLNEKPDYYTKLAKYVEHIEEQSDTSEKTEMAQTQLHFIKYAAEEILEYIEMGGEIEEWYQNKLSKVQSEVESLHSYVEGEKRRTGMVKEQSELDESTPYYKKESLIKRMSKMAKQERLEREKKETEKKQVKEETLEEGRPSQRHPLEGHDYHKKTDAELLYIAKDAHKAAEAMKSHNTTAENKYRDQANDSATVRHFRKTSGMPEWYKKKYGHVKEEVELDEAEDIHSHRVGDEVVLKNKNYSGTIVKSKGSDVSFKNKSDGKHYKATHGMIDRNLSQENRYKERSAVKNKKFDDAIASDMKRIDKSGALKKFGIGVKEEAEQIDEISSELANRYLAKKHERDYEKTGPNTYSSKKPISFNQMTKSFRDTSRALKRATSKKTTQQEEVEHLEEKNVPTSPEKWSQAKAQAKAKFDVYPSAYANGWAAKKYKEMGGGWKSVNEETQLDEDLRQWFDPKHPEGGWKRINSKGEAIGPCAREEGEAKPKCMSNEKRASLTKKERAAAVHAKRKHDSDPERKGEPINVSNYGKGKISEEHYEESQKQPDSRVRHIARQALQKQKEKMIPMKAVKESKKAEIVKDAAKKKKEVFNPEPILSSNITKT